MSVKNLLRFGLMFLYVYTLAFGIFITTSLKVPAPVIFGLPLLFFVKGTPQVFAYYRETSLLILALLLYYIVGMGDYLSFLAYAITIVICAVYFNYFVGMNRQRFNISILLFYGLLLLSMIIMVFDHNNQAMVDAIRDAMLDEKTKQSPSGLSITQFTFGYQIAAFTTFAFIATCAFRQHFLIKMLALCICLVFIYLGMNRSAFICFVSAGMLFLFAYYRFKGVFMVAAAIVIGLIIYTYVLKENSDSKNNILSKNQAKEANDYNRANLAEENLKVYADYPFGLIFYGKSWDDATYKNPAFPPGLTSHNAYLMFLTYLGPFLGLGLIGALYYKPALLLSQTIKNIRLKANALLACLLFSFLAVSLNALSHNGWLVSADGPTLFLYFGILQGAKIYTVQTDTICTEKKCEPCNTTVLS